jgi:peptide chain release factor subunit 1
LEENKEWTVKSNMPLLDWILEHYMEFGAKIELISDQTDVGAQFVTGFGGIGGLLRYQTELPSPDVAKDSEEEYDFDW